MLHKLGILATGIIIIFHWAMAQIQTAMQLKDFIDAGFTVVSLWIFLGYMINKEKRRDAREEKQDKKHDVEIAHHRETIRAKDEEIKRLNSK